MFREITADHDGQFIQSVEVRYLCMLPDHKAVNHLDHAQAFEYVYGPPECSLAAPEHLADRGRFGIDQAIVSPILEEP